MTDIKNFGGVKNHSCDLRNTTEIYGQMFRREGVGENWVSGKSVYWPFIFFTSELYAEVTAGLARYSFLITINYLFLQISKFIINAAFFWSRRLVLNNDANTDVSASSDIHLSSRGHFNK